MSNIDCAASNRELSETSTVLLLTPHELRGSLISPRKLVVVASNVGIHIWSIKYRLITKLIAQFVTNL